MATDTIPSPSLVYGEATFDLGRLPAPLVFCSGDGVVLAWTEAAERVLGVPGVSGARGFEATLLAAGVPEPVDRISASFEHDEPLTIRCGGDERSLVLRSRRFGPDLSAHAFSSREDEHERAQQRAEFQSLVAHEIRSPLAVIQGYAGLLSTGQPGPVNGTQREFLSGIDTKIGELVRLLDDFLDYSRIEAGAMTLNVEPIALQEMVSHVIDEHRATAARRRIDLEWRVEPEDASLLADPLRLRQILDNLVGNAVKYADAGGWVRVEVRNDSQAVAISVEDSGPGLPPEQIHLLFEPFARGSTVGRVAGSGLGLVVVRRLVEAHGGRIDAANVPGGGAVFNVVLPRSSVSD